MTEDSAIIKMLLIIGGAILIALSGFALANKGISYTRQEQIIDMGPIQASAETRETMEIPVFVSAAGLLLGAGLLGVGVRQKGGIHPARPARERIRSQGRAIARGPGLERGPADRPGIVQVIAAW